MFLNSDIPTTTYFPYLLGYGDICNCKHPTKMDTLPPLLNGNKVNIPIAVMASNRPSYLLRMLNSLMQAQGVNRDMVRNRLKVIPVNFKHLILNNV